jgi:hypothetical protein
LGDVALPLFREKAGRMLLSFWVLQRRACPMAHVLFLCVFIEAGVLFLRRRSTPLERGASPDGESREEIPLFYSEGKPREPNAFGEKIAPPSSPPPNRR